MKQRMYCVVLRHLSGIQKGIQAAHAIAEFSIDDDSDEYKQWLHEDKTIVVLEADSSKELLQAYDKLRENNVSANFFRESDIAKSTREFDGVITAIAFLADEQVWDEEKWPNAKFSIPAMGFATDKDQREFFEMLQMTENAKAYGERAAFLRNFRKRFRLASN